MDDQQQPGRLHISPGVLALWVGVAVLGAGFLWAVLGGRDDRHAAPPPPAEAIESDPAASDNAEP